MARVDYNLRIRGRMLQAIRELYTMAEVCKWSHDKLLGMKSEQFAKFPKNVPQWVSAYIGGVETEIRHNLYKNALIFGAYIDGQFYAAWPTHDRYYEKHGLTAEEYNKKSHGRTSHYWAEPTKNGEYKPF